ncbi:MAG: hypothetical protein EPN23_03665 [Verrucomicrobia bacterium]|nr:MAG: hypothetical protein EPN23_03665 [Verrucomicrobiota bacterium]
MTMEDRREPSRTRLILIVLALGLLGAGIRWLAAYWTCQEVKGDYAVDAIMTQHIATGRSLPTFFYGQPYMGVPEIYISSVFLRLFGSSLEVTFAGKVVVSLLVLLALFGWVRDVGDWRAGVAAMLFCLVGPVHLFTFFYGATLLQVVLLLWWGTRLSLGPPRTIAVLGLGLLAGFSWYTNQLVFGTLLAVVLLLVVAWKGQMWWCPMVAGLLGFIVGGWPWWVWNLRHNWQSLAFRGSFRGFSVVEGLQYLALRLAELFDLTKLSPVLLTTTLLFYLLLFIAAGCYICARYRHRPVLRRCLAGLCLLIIFNAYCFAISHFARLPAPRYAIPLLPVYVLLVGLGSAYLIQRRPYSGWLPVLALASLQAWYILPTTRLTSQHDRAIRQVLPPVVNFLQQQKCEAIFAPWTLGWLNFAMQERIAIGEVLDERCVAYERAIEKATHVGFLGDHALQIIGFVRASGGTTAHTNLCGVTLAYGLQPPSQQRRLLAPGDIAEVRHVGASERITAVLDHDLATEWAAPLEVGHGQTLEITFREPVAVQSIGMQSASGRYPALWRVERERADGTWAAATTPLTNDMFFWSGPRIFWHGHAYRLETSFAPIATRKLRLHLGTTRLSDELHMSELLVYAADPQPLRTPTAALPDLIALLHARHLRHVYADRWLANQIHQQSAGRITASREQAVYDRDADEPARVRETGPIPCPLRASSAIIVHQAEAALTRTTLAALQIPMRETALVPWIVFDFAPGTWRPEFGCYENLCWTGLACLRNSQDDKRTATQLARLRRRDAAERALRLWPTHQLALRTIGAATPQPAVPLAIRFNSGVTLSGLTFSPTNSVSGQQLLLTTFWKLDGAQLAEHPVAFFHFLDATGKVCFQDDFGLLEQTPPDALQCPYPGEAIPMTRHIAIAAGRYRVRCGLLNGYTLHRLWPHTDLPTHWLTVDLPRDITVAPATQ